ncbi:MAG: hypothetical protein KJ645_10670, partial [Planctomycetes bacterium]|nr:hypothetical protein [Planctomycetota bacterium]
MSNPADIHAAIRWLIPRVIFLLLLGLFCSSSCVSTIYPPDHVDHACTIYLLKESRHRGIVLPGEGNSFVEY